MSDTGDMIAIFLDIFSGLPRQGPGSNTHTLQALAACVDLPAEPQILDVGCGSGMQTIALARATAGTVIAVEYYQLILNELIASIAASDVAAQITPQQGDMNALPFADDQFDLIWSEGAVYIMRVSAALSAWRRFLKPEGYLVFSEISWIQKNPPQEIRDYWLSEYPAMATIDGNLEKIGAAGYRVLEHFTLPAEDWWQDYYTHLETKLPALDKKYAGHEVAQEILAGVRRELAMHRQYSDWYSYEFFVCQQV